MATEPSQKPIHSIIIDTGPLIQNAVSISTIVASAEVLYTTPAIISEIRDEATRSRVENTLKPFLNIRSPSPASYEAVAAFAKKTGDFTLLSRQDLSILALAYELHCEKHGGPWGLRNAPNGPLVQIEQDQKSTEQQTVDQEPDGGGRFIQHQSETPEQSVKGITETQDQPAEDEPLPREPADTEESALEPPTGAPESDPLTKPVEENLSALQVSEPTQEPTPPTSSDDDSDGDWITPENLTHHQAQDDTTRPLTQQQTQTPVATMTTDFAMQNVLLQMNLNLLSTNMQRIRKLRTSILRCHACFLTIKQMDKQFCPRCGQPTLTRVSCSTNAAGEFRIHLSKKYQHNTRGNRYSIPKPVAGTSNGKVTGKGGGKGGWGRELVLAEDQKEFVRQVDEGRRAKTRDLMDEDYLPGILTGERQRSGGRPKVGAGRNINSRKRF
ncbi:hypothetical protein K458DRAFT_301298 [Lentithecium fluviatile CBS 122367]|uniref:20S-pre-rRNA D-site endonuclease NOB1 n=1 Tax=Lentithecium fluviatile CBS 122367 TaxID=1168545 RepID=A0A6G1J5H6_9PLEO|nr:hypothetical protein K458DRAFT_301298 [Lentithecium fluviatile CBS 122367]